MLYSFPFSTFHLEYICVSGTRYQISFISLLAVRESSPKTTSDTRTQPLKHPRPWWCTPLRAKKAERCEDHCKSEVSLVQIAPYRLAYLKSSIVSPFINWGQIESSLFNPWFPTKGTGRPLCFTEKHAIPASPSLPLSGMKLFLSLMQKALCHILSPLVFCLPAFLLRGKKKDSLTSLLMWRFMGCNRRINSFHVKLLAHCLPKEAPIKSTGATLSNLYFHGNT